MFHKRICKRLKKTAFASVMATALTVTSVCTDGFGVAVHEMVKTEAATDDLFTIKDGVLTSYDYGKLGKDVVIPDGVTKIGEGVFDNEYNIETVTIPDSVKEIGSQAFDRCKKLKTVKFGSGLESIDFRAFEGCTSLNNIQFPKGLTSIGMNAFFGCSALESIDFPTSVTSIEGNAFRDTPWLEAQIANSPDHLVRVNDILLDGTKAVGSVTIPSGVHTIAERAFQGSEMTQVTIPDTVTYIGSMAFQLTGLISINIPDSVTYIGDYAFQLNNKLKTVKIGNGVTELEYAMFYQCTKLEEVNLPDSITIIKDTVFSECSYLHSINMPKNLEELGSWVFNQCVSLEEMVLPEGLEKIGKNAFSYCTNLTSLTVPPSVTTIDGDLYEQCPRLTIKGIKGSYIESYVDKYSYMFFEPVESIIMPTPKSTATVEPTVAPTAEPTAIPTATPTAEPTATPTTEPTAKPTAKPTAAPTVEPTATPTVKPTTTPVTQYTVNFNSMGGVVNPSSKQVTQGEKYGALPTPTRTGYTFLSWRTGSSTGAGAEITSESQVNLSSDQTLYAHWSANKYTVTLDAQGGTISHNELTISFDGTYSELPTPKKENATFVGWYTDSEKLVTQETYCTTAMNHTLYAKWETEGRAANIGELTYNFSNTRNGFSYPIGYKIPLSMYQYVFGETILAKSHYMMAEEWGGNCFGMSSTSVLFHAGTTNLQFKDFNSSASTLSDLSLTDSNQKIKLTLSQLIEIFQVTQFDASIQSSMHNNNIDEVCKQVEEVQNAKGQPVLIAMFGPEGGHAVVGYKIEGNHLYIYDPNYPDDIRTIKVEKDASGKYVSWYYHLNDTYDWKTAREGCSITYIPYEQYKQVWEERSNGRYSNTNMLTLSTKNASIYDVEGKKIAEIKNGQLETEAKDIYSLCETRIDEQNTAQNVSIYLPSDIYMIENTDKTQKQFTADMTHINQGVSVTTEANEIIFAVNDKERINSAVCNAGEGVSYNVSLMSTFEDDKKNVEISGTGTSAGKVGVSQSMGDVELTNCNLNSISVDGQKVNSHNISFGSSQGGTISFHGSQAAAGTQSVLEGDSVTYVMTPEDGYVLSDVLVDGKSVGAVPTFCFSNVRESHHIVAVFTKIGVSTITVDSIGSQKHTGKEVTPVVTVRMGNKVLTENVDYGVVYSNNKNVGTAKVTIIGLGSYTGFEKTVKFTITATKGKTYTVGGMKYQVTDSKKKTITFVSPVSRKKTSVTIPKTVKIGTVTYKVTKIAAKAFNGCSKLNKIMIKSTYLTSVGAQAFKGISKKAVIKVPASKLSKYKKLMKNKGQNKTVKIKK